MNIPREQAFMDALVKGMAISVAGENVESFFEILRNVSWLTIPDSKSYLNDRYYFVLFGNRLLHSHKPTFGGHELDVYIPSFK